MTQTLQAILTETSSFLSARMAVLSRFFQMFIVLGIYNFGYNVIYYEMQNLPCKCVFTFIGPWKQKCFDELLWFTMCYFSSKNKKRLKINYKKMYMLRGDWPKLLPCKWSHLLTLENKYFDELVHLLNVLF